MTSHANSDEEAGMVVVRAPPPTAMTSPTAISNNAYVRRAQAAIRHTATSLMEELWSSTELLFQSKLTWLLIMGPIAVYGDSSGLIGEAACFTCAGLALIPCAERWVQYWL